MMQSGKSTKRMKMPKVNIMRAKKKKKVGTIRLPKLRQAR
jgi:hypothetical protein